ncbi:MAG: hypothetical protein JWP06_586 [Candidatus Saccharibacteria bacterium]|nr:hypothetical protein [Candidatus Saccharibacteria bacterium]
MFLGLLAGIVGIIGYIPYIRDILKGSTRPDRASWLIWLLEYGALFIAQLDAGAGNTLWIVGLQLIGVLSISILSYKYGAGGFDRHSKLLLLVVCVVLGIWYFSSDPVLTILLLLAVELSATVLTTIKVYRQPSSETLTMWILDATAGAIGIVAVGTHKAPILYLYPIALTLMGLSVVIASWTGARRNTTPLLTEERLIGD